MGVLLQAFYKTLPNNAVPSPADGDASVPWWWDNLAAQAAEFRRAGFTAVWLPPVLKTSAGNKIGADGYGTFDDYDIGSKNQKGSVETRFGNRAQLQRCVAAFRSCGIDVYLDLVEHQRVGDTTPFVFRYVEAEGQAGIGRFPKDPTHFVPQVPRDPDLGGPVQDDFPFGRELAPLNGRPPKHYVINNLIDAADWLTRAIDAQGYRIDDVKGLSVDFLRQFLNAKSMSGKFAVGEFFDGNRVLVVGWINNSGAMQGRASAFDFPLKFVLNAMCNSPGQFDMASLDHTGLTGVDPLHSVTFVENHDTDLSGGQKIVVNKILGYAYTLTSEGYPCVYYRDYSKDIGCYGLKPAIDNLIWIHEKLADGTTQQRWLDQRLFVYERLGGAHLLVGLNSDPMGPRTVNVATGFGANVALHDYTGHSPDVVTDGGGSVSITVAPNHDGAGYACYSRTGLEGSVFDLRPIATTQDFDGADDLDIPPAKNGTSVEVGRIWSGAGSEISAVLKPDTTDWTAATSIKLDLVSPDGAVRQNAQFTLASLPGGMLRATATDAGYYTLRLTTAGAPPTNLNPKFTLRVTYHGDPNYQLDRAAPEPQTQGQWGPQFTLANVAIHAHVLPNGHVLYWGRRKQPTNNSFDSLNEHQTHCFVLDPTTKVSIPTANEPLDHSGNPINLFCSGHTFLPDGRLMVCGGHLYDSQGHNAATIYDWNSNSWSAADPMGVAAGAPAPAIMRGRWYPTAITLTDGSVMVCSGSFANGIPAPLPQHPPISTNSTPEIWNEGPWKALTDFSEQLDLQQFLFPRFHLAPDGHVFMSGTSADSFFFDATGKGTWTQSVSRHAAARDYAPSVNYDVGKIVYLGGGNAPKPSNVPTNIVERIDLSHDPISWQPAAPMNFPRRQHNATLLPDGTVLVTGGTRGGGGLGGQGFNDLTAGEPVHAAELWDPTINTWSLMSPEDSDRCYHSTAVLLPDGRVMSAGGGEYQPDDRLQSNDPADTHLTAQLFSPPYLYKGPRPEIINAPDEISYGEEFAVITPDGAAIEKASLVRLSSVTHSFNPNQRIIFLKVSSKDDSVMLAGPPNANVCPPGHYILFLLNKSLVPSIGKILRVKGQPPSPHRIVVPLVDQMARNDELIANATRPAVVVGLTATCPYGLAACWGGAYAGLRQLSGVESVRPIADPAASVAFVYLDNDGLPDLAKWPIEFARSANGSYEWRGVEMTLTGTIDQNGDSLYLAPTPSRPRVLLAPLQRADRVQLNQNSGIALPLPPSEAAACADLATQIAASKGTTIWSVTGPIKQTAAGFLLEVRKFLN